MSLCSLSNKMESKEGNVLFLNSLVLVISPLWIYASRGKGKPVKQVVRTLKFNLSSACQAGGTAIVTSLSFVIPDSCSGEISVSPASRGSSYLTGY